MNFLKFQEQEKKQKCRKDTRKKYTGPAQHIPPKPVRLSEMGHWPNWAEKIMKCKYPKCKGFTQTVCEKCSMWDFVITKITIVSKYFT